MATVSRSLCRCVLSLNRRVPSKRKWGDSLPRRRHLSTTISRLARNDDRDEDGRSPSAGAAEGRKPFNRPFSVDMLDRDDQETYEAMSIADQQKVKEQWMEAQPDIDAAMRAEEQSLNATLQPLVRDPELRIANDSIDESRVPNNEIGLWGDDEDDEFGRVPDGDDGPEGDMTAIAHDELALHREIREYARLAAWDMPFLSKFAKSFEPPPLTSPLRFRYTTYMGEQHPAARKVVVEFSPLDISSLTTQQQLKLKKLAGTRYNPSRDAIKISCEKFETPAQNKRYLGDLVNTLITEAKDETETFEDIPLDVRHHRVKAKPQYPAEWKLTEESATRLVERRVEAKQLEAAKTLVDGQELVGMHIRGETREGQATPVAITAARPAAPRRRL